MTYGFIFFYSMAVTGLCGHLLMRDRTCFSHQLKNILHPASARSVQSFHHTRWLKWLCKCTDLYMKCILKAFWNCSHQIDRNAWGMHSCVHVNAGTLSAHVYACKNHAHTNFHTDCGYKRRTISHISDFCEITFPVLTVKPHHNSWSCFCSKRHFAGMICNRLKVNVTSALPQ